MDKPEISVCCVSLDNPEYVNLLLRGLKRNTSRKFEVLLYINAITNGWEEILKTHADVISVCIKSVRNLGQVQPLNILLKQTRGDYICYMDDDVYPCPGWDNHIIRKVNPDILYQYLCATMMCSPYARPEARGFHYNIFDCGTEYFMFDENLFNSEWYRYKTVLCDTTGPTGAWFITRRLYERMKAVNGIDCDFMCDIYSHADQEGAQVEFRCVADCVYYHFGSIGSTKPNAIPTNIQVGEFLRTRVWNPRIWNNLLALPLIERNIND